ncbi:MAG: HdeD family acid-resistance protein [Alphaproteobacteria bacterium]
MADDLKLAADNMRTAMRTSIRRRRFLYFVQAAALILAGLIALFYPLFTAAALVSLVGWLLVVSGIFQGITLIGAQNTPNFWLQAISAVLSIIIGFLIIGNAGAALAVASVLLVVFFAVEGLSKIIFSLSVRPLPNWGLVLLSGVLSLVLAFVLWAYIPVGAAWLLSVFLGITLLAEGVALGAMAWSAGRLSTAMAETLGEVRGEGAPTREH